MLDFVTVCYHERQPTKHFCRAKFEARYVSLLSEPQCPTRKLQKTINYFCVFKMSNFMRFWT